MKWTNAAATAVRAQERPSNRALAWQSIRRAAAKKTVLASEGFPALVRADARILVLGSLPGQRSLAEHEYYAHPRNAFWPIMKKIFSIGGNYDERCKGLMSNRLALWDVLRSSYRPGSLDADIRLDTAAANDFAAFVVKYPGIEQIVFNGRKAEQLFRRLLPAGPTRHLLLTGLPSTSPAYASMPFSAKLAAWRAGLMSVPFENERSST